MLAPESLPEHLRPFVARQDASLYTPTDHASWRFILRASQAYFAEHAHERYLSGLKETGISTERIPLVVEIDERLRRFGWRAVPVSGFIPPAVFMEFQSLGILPIACEMRTLEHLAYTPAPDIVHEAAGHAPIIADPEYAAYLRAYGEISRKAIFSSEDLAVYEAVRALSVVKEDPASTPEAITQAERELERATAAVTFLSEATLMARMNWWTVEYGLVGDPNDPKIYGAGLLSSLGESYHCLGPEVRRYPLTLACIDTAYDITRPQPQLFVTPDFPHLIRVLEELADTMAFRRGGAEGLAKAVQAKTTCTAELDSGLQISGTFDAYRVQDGEILFLHAVGPTQLAYRDRQIAGHGPEYHRDGFSTIIGPLLSGASLADATDAELAASRDPATGKTTLRFRSGIVITGEAGPPIRESGKLLVLPLTGCTVLSPEGETLFRPEWGTYDLAPALRIVSVSGGAADRGAYSAATGGYRQSPQTPKCNLTPANRALNERYASIRAARENDLSGESLAAELEAAAEFLERDGREDWLLWWEIAELAELRGRSAEARRAHARLRSLRAVAEAPVRELIDRGLALLGRDCG